MIRSAVVFLLLVGLSFSALAQDEPKRVTRVNIPGSFLVDIGVNRGLSSPTN